MSLDVYLKFKGVQNIGGEHIFIREDGQTKEISREEWDRRFPDREPVVWNAPPDDTEVFSANVTHNLNAMAKEAGIYKHLWRPDEIGVTKARQLIEPLERGLEAMKSDPERFKKHNPSNGWGSYEGFIPWIEEYLSACKRYPDADVEASG